jgi:hypothetical protein
MEPLVIHIKCSTQEAHSDLIDVCTKHRFCFIDYEQSWDSWMEQQAQANKPLDLTALNSGFDIILKTNDLERWSDITIIGRRST